MNPSWRSFLATAGAVFADASDEPIHFGDAAGELAAAGDATVLAPLAHLGLIEAAGEDAKAFLHGQLTSDINHLADGQVQLSAWCSAKGRMQASFLVWRDGEAYRLALAADLQEAIQKRLTMFVLRAKVKIASLNEGTVLLGLAGPQAEAALAAAGLPQPAEAMRTAGADGATVLRLEGGRFIVAVAADKAAAVWQALAAQARPVGLPAWRWLDVQTAFPLITAATKEEFVPQMADFEQMGGVSFHKGCYPGQEIVARTQYLGKVKRHLYRVRSTVLPAAGDELHSPENPDQSIGKIMTVAPSPAGGYEGLAVIQANFAASARLHAIDGPTLEASAVNP